MRPSGLRVRLHPTLLLLMGLMLAAGRGGRAALLFLAVLLHEVGHVVAARREGIAARDVALMPFGGVAYLDEAELAEPRVELRVAVAGPLANLAAAAALAALAWLLGRGLPALPGAARPALEAVSQGLRGWAWEHLGLGLFNLLPAFPLDGGRLLRAALARRLGFRRATRLAARLGEVAGAVMAALGAVGYGLAGVGLGAVAMGLVVVYAARMERRRAPGTWVRYLAGRLEQEAEGAGGVAEGRVLVAQEQTPVKEVALRLLPGRRHLVVVTDRRGRLVGLTGEREVVEALIERGIGTPLSGVPYRRV